MSATGWLLLAVAALVTPGLRRRRRPSADVQPRNAVAVTLDLVAAALRSGESLADALTVAAPAADPGTAAALVRVAAMSRLGADPAQAWSAVPRGGPLAEVAVLAARSATSGVRMAGALEAAAVAIRAEQAAAVAARAQRAGVLALLPLAGCFLPAFVCLGVVPVVLGVASGALHRSP